MIHKKLQRKNDETPRKRRCRERDYTQKLRYYELCFACKICQVVYLSRNSTWLHQRRAPGGGDFQRLIVPRKNEAKYQLKDNQLLD